MAKSLIPGVSLHTAILLGLVLGALCGLAVNYANEETRAASKREQLERLPPQVDPSTVEGKPLPWVAPLLTYVTRPIGRAFLNLLTMTVVPLVFASLAVGIAQLGDLRKLGRIGLRTFGFFILSMSAAVLIGLTLVNTFQPGVGLSEETQKKLSEDKRNQEALGDRKPAQFGIETFEKIIPRNPIRAAAEMDMLGIIFFALMFGIGLTVIPKLHSDLLVQALRGISDVMVFIIGVAMLIAPLGVFALIFSVTVELGFDLLRMLIMYVVVVLLGLGIQMFGTLSLMVLAMARVNPLRFFWKARDIAITAFSTSSSSATLPTSIKVSEEQLGIPPQIAGFVLPLGATMNMNGTALFEGVTVLFLAQLTGVPMPLEKQVIVIVLSVMTAIGAAGVPGGSIPLLMMVLASVGVEPERIGLILGVDRLLDMCRTVLNVMGDVAAAAYVARAEGHPPLQVPPPPAEIAQEVESQSP